MSASPQEILLSRVAAIESNLATGTDEEKAELMPKLAALRAAVDAMNAAYEERLSEVRERNATAMSELQNLSKRVERRASASSRAEETMREEKAEKEKQMQKEKVEKAAKAAAAATAAAAAEKSFQRSVAHYPTQMMCGPADMTVLMNAMQPVQYESVVVPLSWTDPTLSAPQMSLCAQHQQFPMPMMAPTYGQENIAPAMQMSPVSEHITSPSPASSPFIPCATPECWDDHNCVGALLIRPNQFAY